MTWRAWFGSWWMVQAWHPRHGISLGVHVDVVSKVNSTNGERYGPYLDLHLGFAMVSVGVNPLWSSEVGCLLGRGGERG